MVASSVSRGALPAGKEAAAAREDDLWANGVPAHDGRRRRTSSRRR